MSDNDFDIFDDLDFKALSDGLGFNQTKKKSNASEPPKTPRKVLNKNKLKPKLGSAHLKTSVLPEVHLNIEQAVAVNPSIAEQIQIDPILKTKSDESIKVLSKVFAWMIDITFIVSLLFFSLITINYFLTGKVSLLTESEFWALSEFSIFAFFAYYIFYFSLLWKTTGQTVGMSFMNLRLYSTLDKEVSFTQSIVRSFLSVISAFSFGITDIIGLTNSLSWTQLKSV